MLITESMAIGGLLLSCADLARESGSGDEQEREGKLFKYKGGEGGQAWRSCLPSRPHQWRELPTRVPTPSRLVHGQVVGVAGFLPPLCTSATMIGFVHAGQAG